MDNRPIGIFDSGVGGLSAVRALERAAPEESFVYFGDTARVPYGDREPADILRLSLQDARFLRTHNIKALVIACNTITANALPQLQSLYPDIPVFGVIQPAVEDALRAGGCRLGVIATNATVQSRIYESTVAKLAPFVSVRSVGCPKLVPLIEANHIDPEDPLLWSALEEYLSPFVSSPVDTLILGCTHYPLIRDAVARFMGPSVTLIDSGAACVESVLSALGNADARAAAGIGTTRYFCSGEKTVFLPVAERFLGYSVSDCSESIDIEIY